MARGYPRVARPGHPCYCLIHQGRTRRTDERTNMQTDNDWDDLDWDNGQTLPNPK